MNLSRWRFLRLLGALAGAGQGFQLPPADDPWWKTETGKAYLAGLYCKEGEERCPSCKQCQKPHKLWDIPADIPAYNQAEQLLMFYMGAWLSHRACSLEGCGVTYVVPRKEGKSFGLVDRKP